MLHIIDDDKLAEVTRIMNRNTDPEVTEEIVETEICADWWSEGAEHQAWIDGADAAAIANWLAAFCE